MENSFSKLISKRFEEDKGFLQLYEILNNMPPDFDRYDKNRIAIFAKRLREARETVAQKIQEEGISFDPATPGSNYCNIRTQKQVAELLGVKPQRVSQYEQGNIESIPVQHLIKFYEMFNVTPHYLVGYTDSPNAVLVKAPQGEYTEARDPLQYPILPYKESAQILSILAWANSEYFLTLCKFLKSSDQTLKTGFELLNVLIKNDPKMADTKED